MILKTASLRRSTSEIIVFFCIMLFVYAAVTKLLDFEKFLVQLGQSPMLTSYKTIIAWAVPGLELCIAALMSFPKTRLMGVYLFFGLMTMFTVYIILVSRFSDYVPCSCGGVIENFSWTEHLIFNLFFVTISGICVTMQLNRPHAEVET